MMNNSVVFYTEIESPIGPLVLAASEKGLCNVEFGRFADREQSLRKWSKRWLDTDCWVPDSHALRKAAEQLDQYFRGERTSFDLPLDLRGTPFQLRVWQALRGIPYGRTASYKQIAADIGNAKGVRAVGGANNRNPMPVVIPCHRVVGTDGSLVGYGGGLAIKTFLLQLEGEKHEIRKHRSS